MYTILNTFSPDDNIYLEMEKPHPLKYTWITHSSRTAFETTLFSFTIKIVHGLLPESIIKVELPEQFVVERLDELSSAIF